MLLSNGAMIKNDVIEAFNKATTNPENINSSGGINWNFVDSDMYMKWGVLLDGELYTEYFEKAADIIEGK